MKTNPCLNCTINEQRHNSEWIFCKKNNREIHVFVLRQHNTCEKVRKTRGNKK